jgi:hypothetical protein
MTKFAMKTIAATLLATVVISVTGCYYDRRDDYYGRRYDGRYDRHNDRRDNGRWDREPWDRDRDRDRWRQDRD